MSETCATCANWQAPQTRYHTMGDCPLLPRHVQSLPGDKCVAWGWVPASEEEMERREKAGLINVKDVGSF